MFVLCVKLYLLLVATCTVCFLSVFLAVVFTVIFYCATVLGVLVAYIKLTPVLALRV